MKPIKTGRRIESASADIDDAPPRDTGIVGLILVVAVVLPAAVPLDVPVVRVDAAVPVTVVMLCAVPVDWTTT